MVRYGFGRDLNFFWMQAPKGSIERTKISGTQRFVREVDKTRWAQNSQNYRRDNWPNLRP